jgi:hypothetical protein
VKVGGSLKVMRKRAEPGLSPAFSDKWVATRPVSSASARLERAVSDRASEKALPRRIESELIQGLRTSIVFESQAN